MKFKKRYFFLLFLLILFFNLGKLLDVTSPPKKMDVIVYLGGGLGERAQKSLELYQKGYSDTGKIIYTGSERFFRTQVYGKHNSSENKKDFFMAHGLSPEDLIYYGASNTMQEVRFVKQYLLDHNLKSVIFVTDPPHSRRVKILADMIAGYRKSGIKAIVVGSDVTWWNKEYYFLSKNGLLYVLLESIKIPYNLLAYYVLEKLGVLKYMKEYLGDFYYALKDFFLDIVSRGWE